MPRRPQSELQPAALVLAAGESTRMGRDKALVQFRGTPFLARIITTFREFRQSMPITVTLGHNKRTVVSKLDLSAVTVAENLSRGDMFSSIVLGLQSIVTESRQLPAVFITPVDQPLINTNILESLWKRCLQSDARIIIPVYENHGGHPIIFHPDVIPEILAFKEQGGLRAFLSTRNDILRIPVDFPHVILNINTPEDLRNLSS